MDLSALTDDQLIELARLVIDEGLRRNPATATATQDMMITAAERARIANLATDLEIRAARARAAPPMHRRGRSSVSPRRETCWPARRRWSIGSRGT
mgnify:CR=1 FL=1